MLVWTGLFEVRAQEELPAVGTIDFYGLRTVTEQQIREKLGIKEGDAAPIPLHFEMNGLQKCLLKFRMWLRGEALPVDRQKAAIHRLERIPHVARADLSTVSLPGNEKVALFVGIEEKGAPRFDYRSNPRGSVQLPDSMVGAEHELMEAWMKMVQTGNAKEDDSQGHALMDDPAVRAIQEKFITFAASDLEILRKVLSESADSRQRAIAALIIGYAPDKRAIIGDLLEAVRDPDPTVRNNATRSIGAIAVLAARKPELGIQIDPAPFIDMLNSITWSDRNKALMVLHSLSENRPADLMQRLRERALPSLIEMARWKTPHAYDAFVLIARIADLDEDQIQNAWERGEREQIIAKVRT